MGPEIVRENPFIEKKLFLNNFDKKINNIIGFKEIINKEIDFRDFREKHNFWEDQDLEFDLGKLFDDFPHKKFDPKLNLPPQVEIVPGNVQALAKFLAKEQQRDMRGHLRYLLTSGLAVEVITGFSRFHHDLDLVILDHNNGWWLKYIVDKVTADRYWADMKFDSAFLEQTAWTAQFQANGRMCKVSTVHPAIILVQKLSDAWGRPPRKRDIIDVKELIKFWRESQNSDPNWDCLIETAIAALPEKEQPKTKERISAYIPKPALQVPHLGILARLGFR
ncbi:MAG: hypothetical protein V1808_00460 [Candidatus Daviesbacteria bacterium]